MADTPEKRSSRQEKKEQEHRETGNTAGREQKIHELWEKAYNPGGQAQNDRLAQQGKKASAPARPAAHRPGTDFFELSRGAGFGSATRASTTYLRRLVTGIGKIHGNWVMILANDSRVSAGAYYPSAARSTCGRRRSPSAAA